MLQPPEKVELHKALGEPPLHEVPAPVPREEVKMSVVPAAFVISLALPIKQLALFDADFVLGRV